MKRKINLIMLMLQVMVVSMVSLMIITFLSSKEYSYNDSKVITKGFPLDFYYFNDKTSINYLNFVLDIIFAFVLGFMICIICNFLRHSDYIRFKYKLIARLISVILAINLPFINYTGTNAYVYLMNWRLMNNGKLYYTVADGYVNKAGQARDIWNGAISGVVARRDNYFDVYIQGSSNLGADIAGLTYPSGAIYINSVVWSFNNGNLRLNTMTHEMGHALGLADDHTSSNNIMYYKQSNTTTLSVNDIESFNSSYALSFMK